MNTIEVNSDGKCTDLPDLTQISQNLTKGLSVKFAGLTEAGKFMLTILAMSQAHATKKDLRRRKFLLNTRTRLFVKQLEDHTLLEIMTSKALRELQKKVCVFACVRYSSPLFPYSAQAFSCRPLAYFSFTSIVYTSLLTSITYASLPTSVPKHD